MPTTPPPADEYEPVPPAAASVFGGQLDLAAELAALLCGDGVDHGLIGPRERSRMWTRHVLNCAAVGDLIPSGSRVVDVGSGAGLPGLVLAVRDPSLQVDLVEPLLRRTRFLENAVARLALGDRVRVVRGRAETPEVRRIVGDAPVATARAVAALDRLASWCVPLLAPGGELLALKGAGAADEATEHAAAVRRLGGGEPTVVQCGTHYLDPPSTVIRILRMRAAGRAGAERRKGAGTAPGARGRR